MRIADIQLSFPAILIALLVVGVARVLIAAANARAGGDHRADRRDRPVDWVQYARTVRGSTMVEKNKEYVRPRA